MTDSSRRWRTLPPHGLSLAIIIVMSTAAHTTWRLTPRMTLDFLSLAVLGPLYAGYKAGPSTGALVGVASAMLALLTTWALNEREGFWTLLASGSGHIAYVSVGYFSLPWTIVLAGAGWLAGRAMDRLEAHLARASLTLDELLPVRPGKPQIDRLVRGIGRLSGTSRKPAPEEAGAGRKNLVDAAFRMVIPLPFLAIALAANVVVPLNFEEPLHLRILVPQASVVMIAIAAFHGGSRIGVALTWIFYAALLVALGLFLADGELGLSVFDEWGIRLSILFPAQVVGLSVVAWWVGKAGELYRDEARFTGLRTLLPFQDGRSDRSVAPDSMLLVVLLLAVDLSADFGDFRLVYRPYLALAVGAAVLGYRWQATSVSNRMLATALVLAFVQVSTGSEWGESGSVTLQSLWTDAIVVALLAAIPIAAGRLDLRRSDHCRFLIGAFVLGLLARDLVLGGGSLYYPDRVANLPLLQGGGTWWPLMISIDSWIELPLNLGLTVLLLFAAVRLLPWLGIVKLTSPSIWGHRRSHR